MVIQGLARRAEGLAAKVSAAVGAFMAAVMASPVAAQATTFKAYTGKDGSGIVSTLGTTVGQVATYIGIIFVIVGVLAFFIAFRNEDSEGKNRAGIGIAAGIGLLGFTTIISLFL